MTLAFRKGTKMKSLLKLSILALAGLSLAACGSGGGGVRGPGPVPPVAKLEDSFGAGFATTFQKAANSDPREPAAGDVIAVSLTSDPVPIP